MRCPNCGSPLEDPQDCRNCGWPKDAKQVLGEVGEAIREAYNGWPPEVQERFKRDMAKAAEEDKKMVEDATSSSGEQAGGTV